MFTVQTKPIHVVGIHHDDAEGFTARIQEETSLTAWSLDGLVAVTENDRSALDVLTELAPLLAASPALSVSTTTLAADCDQEDLFMSGAVPHLVEYTHPLDFGDGDVGPLRDALEQLHADEQLAAVTTDITADACTIKAVLYAPDYLIAVELMHRLGDVLTAIVADLGIGGKDSWGGGLMTSLDTPRRWSTLDTLIDGIDTGRKITVAEWFEEE